MMKNSDRGSGVSGRANADEVFDKCGLGVPPSCAVELIVDKETGSLDLVCAQPGPLPECAELVALNLVIIPGLKESPLHHGAMKGLSLRAQVFVKGVGQIRTTIRSRVLGGILLDEPLKGGRDGWVGAHQLVALSECDEGWNQWVHWVRL